MTLIVVNPGHKAPSGARIGYQNLLELGTVTPSSENPAYPVANAFDGNASDFFRPAAGGSVTIELELEDGMQADYFAFYAQDVHTFSGSLTLQYWDGSAWVDAAGAAPSSNAPVMVYFDAVSSDRWRVRIVCPSVFNLGCVSFGKMLELPHGQYRGWTPPRLARRTESINSVSDGGNFLGRSVINRGVEFALVLQYAPDAWVWENWPAFVKHAEEKPFFICPDQSRPADVAWGWVSGDIPPPSHTHFGFMGTSLSVRGVVE